mmetsp:Transcript_31690/g.57736  ORF Transcript_31690/g.57736 Transcript_31690/m.57736 type:complete len:1635 (-) Transcript_31690:46-4950(-)
MYGFTWLPFFVWTATSEPLSQDNAAWNVNVESKHEPESYRGEWAGHTYFPSPPDWRSLTIYQLITDRFADGDPRNNELFDGGFDVRDMTFRHGGDFKGLTEKLHYIKGLGCQAIWISPVFQNGFNSYHQYAMLDFTVLDRRLGTLEELRALTEKAHELGMYVIIDVVMNHMANEFHFEGHAETQAPWRFHDGEYKLVPRKSAAEEFATNKWCGGEGIFSKWGNEAVGVLSNIDACAERCRTDPDCRYFLWKDDLGSLSTYHCAGFSDCSSPGQFTDGIAKVYKMIEYQVKAKEHASDSWCGDSLWQEWGQNNSGILASQDACEGACAADDGCQYYLWKDDPAAATRFHCAAFATCDVQYPYDDGDASTVFEKRSISERNLDGMYDTPVGRQPYADFWYNNTWYPDAKYNGTIYGQYGEWEDDPGFGTYIESDFHHNGDLKDYYDHWQINFGKIYGVMDDLRLEHERVQQKYIAMTKALIESADIDGFRVDTPMQVPLNFYKTWAPAMRKHAKSLGKERFGIFGEFYVTTARYATMTGRGKDNSMYDSDRFIDDVFTLKGGIVYPYYWYIFTAMVHKQPQYADGLPLAYREENKRIDTLDPMTQRNEYAMWTFCNNHDNWRMQSMTGKSEMQMCLAVITFWPGIPLHYAGDEQDFDTPGSALDGWAREELSASLAWQAVRTQPNGNPADRDNFDMTKSSYRYTARLNALRHLYFGDFGREECDELQLPSSAIADVLVFVRGCTSSRKVLVFANFHSEDQKSAETGVPWTAGTVLADSLVTSNPLQLTVSESGTVSVTLEPLQALVLVETPVLAVPPAVVAVDPGHGMTAEWPADDSEVTVSLTFDRDMDASVTAAIKFDDESATFECQGSTCTLILSASAVGNGHHYISIAEGALAADGTQLPAEFRSSFLVDREAGVIAEGSTHEMAGLICDGGLKICHKANGASWYRVKNVGGNWSEWRQYEAVSDWSAQPGAPVLVQYWSEKSASFIVADCADGEERCHSSWHSEMFLRGAWNYWGSGAEKGRMQLVDHFTWATTLTLSSFQKGKFTATDDWSKSYGVHEDRPLLYNFELFDERSSTSPPSGYMSGSEAGRKWMVQRGLWTDHESIASGAEFAKEIWFSHLCTAAAPECVPPSTTSQWACHNWEQGQDQDWCRSVGSQDCIEYSENDGSDEMSSCGVCSCCKKPVDVVETGEEQTCCVLLNDLLLNYTITSDLSRCSPGSDGSPVSEASTTISSSIEESTSSSASQITTLQSKGCISERIRVRSAGADDGNFAEFWLDGSQVELASGRGLSVVILASDGGVQSKHVYDTGYQGEGSQPFTELLDSLPDGTVVLVAAMDDATDSLTEEARVALTNLGATQAGGISYRGSYALLGTKGGMAYAEGAAPAGAGIVELDSNVLLGSCDGSSSTVALSTTKAAERPAVDITVKSAGADDGNFVEFWLEGSKVELDPGRGLSVVILRSDGGIESTHVYDTGYLGEGSGPFTALVNSLPDGTVALVAAMDDATDSLTEEAREALASLGATRAGSISYRGSYALIGIKGGAALAEAVAAGGAGAVEISSSLAESPSTSTRSAVGSTSSAEGSTSSAEGSTSGQQEDGATSTTEWQEEEMSGCMHRKLQVLVVLLLRWSLS